jgi:hypothetical protein
MKVKELHFSNNDHETFSLAVSIILKMKTSILRDYITGTFIKNQMRFKYLIDFIHEYNSYKEKLPESDNKSSLQKWI